MQIVAIMMLFFWGVVGLNGCQPLDQAIHIHELNQKIEKLESQIKDSEGKYLTLQTQLVDQEGRRRADLEYLEAQAGIAAACDFLVPLCPDSVTKTGRQAQADGINGGTSGQFWLWFVLKFLVGGGATGGLIGVVVIFWQQLGKPNSAAVKQAREIVQQAEARAHAAQERAEEARRWAENQHANAKKIKKSNIAAWARLKAIHIKIQGAEELLALAEKEHAAKKRMTEALTDAF